MTKIKAKKPTQSKKVSKPKPQSRKNQTDMPKMPKMPRDMDQRMMGAMMPGAARGPKR